MTQPLRLLVCLVVLVGFPLAATAQEFGPLEQPPANPVEKIDNKDVERPVLPPGFPSSDESALPSRFPEYEYRYTPINYPAPYTPPSSSGRGAFSGIAVVIGIGLAILHGVFGKRK